MATFIGIPTQNIELEKIESPYNILESDYISEMLLGTVSRGIITPYIRTFNALSTEPFTGYIGLDNKIYLQPETFVYDIINENFEEDIVVWNADKYGHWINSVSVDGSDGIELDMPDTPLYFTPETAVIWKLTVKEDGPAVQNTTITISWDTGQVNTISISGSRILAFPYINNYSTTVIIL